MLRMNGLIPGSIVASLCVGVIWLLTSTACAQPAGSTVKGDVRTNIYYAASPAGQADDYLKERCVLDLYLPEGQTGFATVVWFHEGNFRSGKRTIPELLKDREMAVAAPDYRLRPKVACEEAIADAAQAVAYILKNIEKFGGNPEHVFVAGSGTGGYLAGLIALDKSLLERCGIPEAKVAGLISINGTACTHPAVLEERGGEVVGHIIADLLAPMRHVRKDAPAVLLATADRRLEKSELYESNAYMWRMLQVAGHRNNRLCELQGYTCDDLEMFLPLVPRFVEEQCEKLDAGKESK